MLRAKVSVFVELWAKNDQLREAADSSGRRERELTAAQTAIRNARDLLRDAGDDADKLRAAVAEAIELLDRAAG